MKGTVQPDHIPTNNYKLLVVGVAPITATTISGIEDELQTTELPDRTVASGGHRGPSEVTLGVPLHHEIEQLAIEAWFKESQDPVSPGYKKAGSLIFTSVSGAITRSFTIVGIFPKKRALPEGDMAGEGEAAIVEWTFLMDDLLPI